MSFNQAFSFVILASVLLLAIFFIDTFYHDVDAGTYLLVDKSLNDERLNSKNRSALRTRFNDFFDDKKITQYEFDVLEKYYKSLLLSQLKETLLTRENNGFEQLNKEGDDL